MGGELAKALLESPMQELDIDLSSDADTFDLSSTVSYAFDARHAGGFRSQDVMDAVKRTAELNGEVIERGGNYIFNGSKGTQFVLGRDISLDRLTLSTGKVRNFVFDATQVVPSPEMGEETFTNALADMQEVLSTIVEESYRIAGKPVPDQEIEIHPPKRRADGGIGRAAVSGAEGLLDKIDIERPTVTFDEIGGQGDAKKEIEGLAFALSNPGLYEKWGTKPPKGILLYGPPGTGKTLMAKALASQANARFLHISASDIGSKWYGESEQLVQNIFDFANEGNGNTIIYFDEIDSIVPVRDGQHEATQRVIGTLLQNIDGMESKRNVLIVASTNRMQSIDSAMLRPGRLDRLVEVGLPDIEGRKAIFDIHMAKAQAVAGDEFELFNGINMEQIINQTDGYSGADVAEIVRRVLEEKVRVEGSTGEQPGQVNTADILNQIHNYERVRTDRSK